MIGKITSLAFVTSLSIALFSSPSSAASCTGNCGLFGPDGDVTAPPGGNPYIYVSTFDGVDGAGQIDSAGGTSGSEFITNVFSANVGDPLNFYFNYVTSDGTGEFPDYGFAELQTDAGDSVGFLFTARTVVNPGDTSPGFGLPANISTLTPATSPIQDGLTNWSPLGDSSGECFDGPGQGCGLTGWIQSSYDIQAAGIYRIRFGATNFGDTEFDSGLAFSGITINGRAIDQVGGVPEPETWAMMILGLGLAGARLRRTKINWNHNARPEA